MKRIEFLRTLGLGAAGIAASESLLSGCMNMDMDAMNAVAPAVAPGTFSTPLLTPETAVSGTPLNAHSMSGSIIPGKSGPMLGYRNTILGPTIRVERGSMVDFPFTNGLTEDTNIHWHGLLVPPAMDGHPEQMVNAGQSFNYSFKIDQPAGMAWYHPHPHMQTGRQVFMGLAGMFIIDSPEERALKLPSGDYEIPLVIQDKRVDANGGLVYNPTMGEVMIGYMGDTITVNGAHTPYRKVASRTYRLRVLNGSNARIYNLALSSADSFMIIGSDGGLLPASETATNLLLAPGERADLLLDFSKISLNGEVFLQSNPFSGADSQGSQGFKIMKFVVDRTESDPFTLPATLNSIPVMPAASATKTRTFDIGISMEGSGKHKMGKMKSMAGMHTINGKTFSMDRIDESV
ncbi:multicopper oxidase family protein, partial [Persicitalea sp.]|uniref:multicopper oxidase family protein n=1 Tax=Persicitalea sp. TaxID=3100273 RepID=UPI003593847F